MKAFLIFFYLFVIWSEPRHLHLSLYFFIYFSFPCLFKFVLHFCWWPNRYQGINFIRSPLLDAFFTVFTHHLGWRLKKNGGGNFCCWWGSSAHNLCWWCPILATSGSHAGAGFSAPAPAEFWSKRAELVPDKAPAPCRWKQDTGELSLNGELMSTSSHEIMKCRDKIGWSLVQICSATVLKTIHKYKVQLVDGDIPSHELMGLPNIHICTTGDNKEKDSSLASTNKWSIFISPSSCDSGLSSSLSSPGECAVQCKPTVC